MYYPHSRHRPIAFDGCVKLPVVYFEHPNWPPSQTLASINYYTCQYFEVPDTPCAIVPGSAPSAETLLEAYELTRWDHFSIDGPFKGMYKAVTIFIRRYCNSSLKLPLVSFRQAHSCLEFVSFDNTRV
jgi:hypothetical protein